MKTKHFALCAAMSLMMSGSAFAACTKPADPEIPAGATASGADMLKAKKAIETYMADVEKYLDCGLDSNTQQRAIDEMEKIAARYNEELRVYKAKS